MTRSEEVVVLSFDDSIEEKRYSDESELLCWHYDHALKRSVKGVNFLSAFVQAGGMRLPCAVEFVKKDKWAVNEKTGKQKRVSSKTKNELFREMVRECADKLRFDYVMTDSWYASAENMQAIRAELNTHFIMAVKSNRKVALSHAGKEARKYISIESLQPGQQTVEGWLEELDFPLLSRQGGIFKNEDDAVGELYRPVVIRAYRMSKSLFSTKNGGGGRISQIGEKQYRFCQIAYQNHQNTNQSLRALHCSVYKTGMTQTTNRQQSLCPESENLSGSPTSRLSTTKIIHTT